MRIIAPVALQLPPHGSRAGAALLYGAVTGGMVDYLRLYLT